MHAPNKNGGINPVLWAQTSHLSEMMRVLFTYEYYANPDIQLGEQCYYRERFNLEHYA